VLGLVTACGKDSGATQQEKLHLLRVSDLESFVKDKISLLQCRFRGTVEIMGR
jgi:hypothetical protein